MAKLYPFKYRFENKGIQPLHDSIWFESHQELLLRIVNTPQGRDLLCIDKSFDGVPIVGFAKNRVTGFLGYEGENVKLVSDFRVGAKWANVVRYRWREFQALAREHYSDKVSGQTEILLNGQHRMAATTSTFWPNADGDPSPTTTDGMCLRTVAGTWTSLVNGAGNLSFDDIADAWAWGTESNASSPNWNNIARGFYLFNTSAIPDADEISSGVLSLYDEAFTKDLAGITPTINIYSSNPTSDTALANADYGTQGSTPFATAITWAGWNSGVYNPFTFNASGLAAISKTGISKFSSGNPEYDVADNAPIHPGSAQVSGFRIYNADQAGTSNDPKLVVVHSAAGFNNLLLTGVG